MSTGTNKERITQNNGIIIDNNADLTALKTKINNLPTSGDTTATASDIALGKTAVSKGIKITGTYTPPTVSLQSKDVTINQNGTTTVTADTGYDGLSDVDVTVEGVLDTSDATATANDMASGETAYVNGQKITGNVSQWNTKGLFDRDNVPVTNYVPTESSNYDYIFFEQKIDTDNTKPIMFNAGGEIRAKASKSALKSAIGLTADKIKKDEIILGVTGTYEGEGGTKVVLANGTKFKGSTVSNFDWLENCDISNITSMDSMFEGCSNLTSFPSIDTKNITNMYRFINGCSSLTAIPLLDLSGITSFGEVFYGASGLQTIPLLNTSNITNMSRAFEGCSNLTSFPSIDTSNVTNMYQLAYWCRNLTTVPQLNTSKVKNMYWAFKNCDLLSNESLNNILAMCINISPQYSRNKTLLEIGLSQAQATTCQTLSNWDAFVAAGWSSGYTS